jgi:hypothetical protein
MNEVLVGIDSITANRGSGGLIIASNDEQQFIDSDKNFTDRELLSYSYGIIPMEGRDAFIAFAKPKMACPIAEQTLQTRSLLCQNVSVLLLLCI